MCEASATMNQACTTQCSHLMHCSVVVLLQGRHFASPWWFNRLHGMFVSMLRCGVAGVDCPHSQQRRSMLIVFTRGVCVCGWKKVWSTVLTGAASPLPAGMHLEKSYSQGLHTITAAARRAPCV